VHLEIKAYYRKAKGNKMLYPCLKVDADNLIKVVCDALNGVAYIDDKQVVSVVMDKLWGEPEKVVVIIEEAPLF
jgi:Holliday junction resolvase RusA-like endonuclease